MAGEGQETTTSGSVEEFLRGVAAGKTEFSHDLSDPEIPVEEAQRVSGELAKEFGNTFRNSPEYSQAVLKAHWERAIQMKKTNDNKVRFTKGGYRYAVLYQEDGDYRINSVYLRRRKVEGAILNDDAEIAEEAINKDYWEETLLVSPAYPKRIHEPNMGPHIWFVSPTSGPDGRQIIRNTQRSVNFAKAILNDLKAPSPLGSGAPSST